MIGILGGAFDPPHEGHLALARAALDQLGVERLLVLVVDAPGHKDVELDAETRLCLAEAAFADLPRTEVRRDPHARTIESVRAGDFGDAIFLVGADEFAEFLEWQEPDELLEHVRLGVATRPGFPREVLDRVLSRLRRPDRVTLFEIEPLEIASRDIRARAADGRSLDGLVPAGVAELIEERGLYRRSSGLH